MQHIDASGVSAIVGVIGLLITITAGFTNIATRLTRIETKLDNGSERFDGIDTRLEDHEVRLRKLEQKGNTP